jgi:hypothetical protein
MRIAPGVAFVLAACFAAGCALAQLTQGGGSETETAATAAADAGGDTAAAEPAVKGAGCGVESGSGAQLCIATSLCPTVVVDTQALPHCGFRIKAGSSELVCACGESICSMGAFTTCAQAAQLLLTQTEAAVCAQVAEERCTTPTPAVGSSGSSGASSSSGSPCDKTCLQECGGGGGCASICGC